MGSLLLKRESHRKCGSDDCLLVCCCVVIGIVDKDTNVRRERTKLIALGEMIRKRVSWTGEDSEELAVLWVVLTVAVVAVWGEQI